MPARQPGLKTNAMPRSRAASVTLSFAKCATLTAAFFTAFDAEVDGREGQNYLWTAQQILEVLGPVDGLEFNTLYGVDRGPNFADPHHSNGVPEAEHPLSCG